MQKTGFLIPGLEKGVNLGCDHYGAVNSHFSVYLAIFSMVTIQQLGDPSANLLVTSQKAVFCNNTHVQWETWF